MATCSVQGLLTDAAGFLALVNKGDAMAVRLYLLSLIDGEAFTAQQLLSAAGQFRDLTPGDAEAVALQQLCNWSGGNS